MNKLNPNIKKTLIILGLIFLPPVGLFFALKKTAWSKRTKIIISVVTVIWVAIIVVAAVTAPPTVSMSNIKTSGNPAVEQDSVLLKGEVYPTGSKLTVSGKNVDVNNNGEYSYRAPLKEGDNNLVVTVKDGDKVTTKTYKVHRLTTKEVANKKAARAKANKEQAAKKAFKVEADKKAAAERAKQAADAKAKADKKTADARASAAKKAADAKAKAAAEAQKRAAAEAARNQPKTSFGSGTFLVNKDIAPGTYKTDNLAGYCYYERLSGTSGSFGDIITNGNPTGQAIISIAPSDVAFKSQNCGTWTRI